ncbi:MAG TPA: CAP domain-containing protein [Planctomycetota bacterium]|nr:CAP domain-containing protein [Planctomycetota bacterium]
MASRSVPVSLAFLAAACLSIIAPGRAQEKAPDPAAPVAPEPEEAEWLERAGKELAAYATLCFKNGFPVRARQSWLEVIGEYLPDDEASRKALGFYKNGTVWQHDAKFEYPDQDEPNASVARMLAGRWDTLAKKLGDGHRALAAQLSEAGKAVRAAYHTQRALRFLPKDGKVIAQSGMKQFEGVTGDEIDLGILRRSRLMDRAITRLCEQQIATTVGSEKHKVLDEGGMPYISVKTENFTIFGDWEPEVLQQAAAWCERSLAFCKEAYEGYEGFPPSGQPTKNLAFFKKKDTWVELVKANAERVGRDRVEFMTTNASSTQISDVHTSGAEDADTVYDYAVRCVAQDYSGLGSDAMREGIGHAIVGMFFGRNLIFSVGQQKLEGTVSGSREQQKLLLPDMDTWRELAVEIAWSKGGTSAARLPLLKAAQFPTDGRIKAWSFCDYLLRRDPLLLRHLDRTASKARTENDVLGLFQEYAAQPLQHVEDRWRRFWTEDGAIKRAILEKSTPLEATSKEAPIWLEQFNRIRTQYERKPVGWSAQLSVDCKEHVDYLRANKDQRGPDKEHTELAGKTGFSNSGRTFAQTALVWIGKDAKKAADLWMLMPGYRDALLNPNIDTVGVYAEGGIMVLDANRGRDGKEKLTSAIYPVANLKGGRMKETVPAAVEVELLGPEVQSLLAQHKRGKQKEIGYPLTAHFFWSTPKNLTCEVTSQGAPVEGWLVDTKGTIRRTSAPGLWVFYPAEPLHKGVDIRAVWKWEGGSHDVTFMAN